MKLPAVRSSLSKSLAIHNGARCRRLAAQSLSNYSYGVHHAKKFRHNRWNFFAFGVVSELEAVCGQPERRDTMPQSLAEFLRSNPGEADIKLCGCGCGEPLEPRFDGIRHTIDGREVNDGCYFNRMSEEIDRYPIGRPCGLRGV